MTQALAAAERDTPVCHIPGHRPRARATWARHPSSPHTDVTEGHKARTLRLRTAQPLPHPRPVKR